MGSDSGFGNGVSGDLPRRAVFLDRDGVLNANVLYPDTGRWESPRALREFALLPGVLPGLRRLANADYLLFVVSNQPNVVKGKTTPQDFAGMCERLRAELADGGVPLTDAFYCTHHPKWTEPCACRKPSSYFLEKAAREHGLSLRECWMIGDRSTDMECGRRAGARTAWIDTGQEPVKPAQSLCDLVCLNLAEAVSAMLACDQPAAAAIPGSTIERTPGSISGRISGNGNGASSV